MVFENGRKWNSVVPDRVVARKKELEETRLKEEAL
jgi:hypothetical protein